MSNDRAERVKHLFQEAAERVGDDRERFLAERCGTDTTLRAEVEGLLDADKCVHSRFLEGAPQTPPEIAMPARIGRFRLLRRIGEGGMGSVFEAEQDHPRRKVALKIIRVAMVSESLLRRFEYEVQILGQLKHPGIAQIYEAGTHDDGSGPVPYFAMEYIRGRPLMDFVKHHLLTVRQRLGLMSEICDAVHHAHQKGVIHRDLKPANVLVEETDGVERHPKILDFGVARAIRSDVQLITMHTEVGQLVGTLSYMSPEQVAGQPDELDVRSDVYALGVILYEMLAGRLPYDLRDHSIAEAGSVIREQEPSRLSSLDSALRGDIETIVAKALAKEKDRRYQSAMELGDDIRRFLRDEPIVARPASRAYQIRKFAKRNKAIVGGVAAVFVTLILGIIGIGVALLRATEAERVALLRSEESLRSLAKAAAVSTFLQEMLSSVDPAKSLGREVTIRQALDEAAAKIESGS
ncbi:MAG: serine/threonine-protein kinase, partial [Phycisphaerales bacterium]|nr:serine/threonine-protein kinase [Phycisphaerales bacterium]